MEKPTNGLSRKIIDGLLFGGLLTGAIIVGIYKNQVDTLTKEVDRILQRRGAVQISMEADQRITRLEASVADLTRRMEKQEQ